MSRSVRPDYAALRAPQAAADTHAEAEAYAQAILTRRRRKCIAEGAHTEDCQRCGL